MRQLQLDLTDWDYVDNWPHSAEQEVDPLHLYFFAEPESEYYCDVCGTHYPADDPCPWH